MDFNRQESFDAEDFVDRLLTEGEKAPCDETCKSFRQNGDLPPFYDEKLYERGCKFFNDNIFALFLTKLLGLISVLSIPSVLRILMHTKMSSSTLTAYRRYLSTLFHMCIWYNSDFKPGSRLWRSIAEVKGKHNSASKKGCAAGLQRISQRDMALTQFGFMGFALTKRESVGLYNIKDEEWRAFVHIWRVVGSLMGIEDRFNICRESLEETRAICELLLEKVFKPHFEMRDRDFIDMATYLLEGMWAMNPLLDAKSYLLFTQSLVYSSQTTNNNNNNNANRTFSKPYEPLVEVTVREKIYSYIIKNTMWTLRFKIFRLYHNYVQHMSLWLMKVFPFLAFYMFGRENSFVAVVPESEHVK